MRTPKITAKRALGLALAGALAIGGTVAVANTSQAATTLAAMKFSPATGSSTSTTAITATGKGFADSTGASLVKAVRFISAGTTCGTDATAGTAASSYNVVSATKMGIVAPALAAGTWLACAYDSTSASTAAAMGSAKFVTAAPPTATTFAESATNVASASALGGTVVTVTGTNFTKATTATIDGLKTTVTYVSATKITAKLPAHAAGTGYKLKVTTEYGSASTTDTVSFVGVVAKVTPSTGSGALGNVVTITGSGFNAATFATTSGTVVGFIPGGTTLTAGTTTAASMNPCTSVIVESDTSLSCQAPALSGAYSVQLLNVDGAGKYTTSFTTVSKTATYTAAAF